MSESNVSEFFDSYAHDFDAIYGNKNGFVNSIVNRLFRQAMKLRYQKTLEACTPVAGRSVLDVGCGAGVWVKRMQDLGWQARGQEIDPGGVAAARARGVRASSCRQTWMSWWTISPASRWRLRPARLSTWRSPWLKNTTCVVGCPVTPLHTEQ